ncbi:hypothetical protein KCV87_14700 [Actinosynnema pretiosum subsp. pretiosum]|uniref:Uncharacterized protein n=1 Tax=Actinosynnema pretiosum subsp. pretiosum TaxID=103721 RepID=A0AA45R6Y6_9PSEU|nr:hypothetical protein KCV87_14700 [Actinosynnema pretiosum subsp. pretiosum]
MDKKLVRNVEPEMARLRGKVGMAVKHGRRDEEAQYRMELKTAVLEQRIRETVDTWPPLSPAMRTRLAALLAPVAGGAE